MALVVLVLWLLPAVIAAQIGANKAAPENKTKRAALAFLLAATLWVLGLIIVMMSRPDPARVPAGYVKCPHCLEPVQSAATVCPHCQRDTEA
jgi:hypothetical protein